MLFISHRSVIFCYSSPKRLSQIQSSMSPPAEKHPWVPITLTYFIPCNEALSVQWEIWSTMRTSGIRGKKRTNLSKDWMTTICTVITIRKLYVRQLWFSLHTYTPRHTHACTHTHACLVTEQKNHCFILGDYNLIYINCGEWLWASCQEDLVTFFRLSFSGSTHSFEYSLRYLWLFCHLWLSYTLYLSY